MWTSPISRAVRDVVRDGAGGVRAGVLPERSERERAVPSFRPHDQRDHDGQYEVPDRHAPSSLLL